MTRPEQQTTFRFLSLTLVVGALFVLCEPALAQVAEATAPSPAGYKMGEFRVMPNASVGATWNDNIYGAPSNTKDDTITTVAMSVKANSEWARNRLNLDAGVSADYYNDYSSEDTVDWWAGADGRLDLSAKSHALGGIRFSQDHEDRASPDATAGAAEPTVFSTSHGHLGFAHRLAPFTIRIGAVYEVLNHDDVAATGGGMLDNDFRDRDQYSLGTRFSYELDAKKEIFFQAATDTREYHDKTVGRNSDGYRLGLGLRFNQGANLQAEGFLGYMSQDYDSLLLKDVNGLYYGANLKWKINDQTLLNGRIDRSINETTLAGASSHLDTGFSARLEHDLNAQTTLNASLGYTNSDYQGVNLTLNEWAAGVGARHYLDKRFYVAGGYRHINRDANSIAYEYTKDLFFVSLGYAPRGR